MLVLINNNTIETDHICLVEFIKCDVRLTDNDAVYNPSISFYIEFVSGKSLLIEKRLMSRSSYCVMRHPEFKVDYEKLKADRVEARAYSEYISRERRTIWSVNEQLIKCWKKRSWGRKKKCQIIYNS